jgi:hypothetical protein
MTRATHISLYILVFVVGAAAGGYAGYRFADARAFLDEVTEVAHYSALLDVQRSKGSDAAYEETLRGYLAMLERHKGSESPLFSGKTIAVDTALTYARLSVLAMKRGSHDEAKEILSRAVALCPELQWQECSGEAIVAVVQRLDKSRSGK